MWRLLLSQGLAEHDGRQWRLSLRTRQWLGQPDAEQWQACFVAWRDDRGWDELRDLPSLLCDPGGCPNEPWLARKRLCRILEQIPEDRWWDLGSFLAALRKHHPNYLRPDGDMDSWFVREASSGAFLRGPEHWDAIEGALAHHLIVGPLHWLGVIDLGEGDPDPGDDTGRTLFRISGAGKDLLTELPPHLADARPGEPLATVDTRLRVTIRVRDSRYQRYQLERLAQWEGQDGVARYWLSEDAVWQAQNSGVTADQILAFLRRITKDRVPEIVVQTLRAWGRRFGGATLKRAVILETDDTSMMKRIRQMPGISNLLGQELGPTRCIVSEENMDRVVAELKKQNIWPRIEH